MKKAIIISAFAILLSIIIIPTQRQNQTSGQTLHIVAYITLQNPDNYKYNGIGGIDLYSPEPGTIVGDILKLELPNIPYYTHHFPDYSRVVTANFRFDKDVVDSWSKIDPSSWIDPQ